MARVVQAWLRQVAKSDLRGVQRNAQGLTATTFARAREAGEAALAGYEQTITSKLEPAGDPQSVGVHAQIRGQLLAIKDPAERMNLAANTKLETGLSVDCYHQTPVMTKATHKILNGWFVLGVSMQAKEGEQRALLGIKRTWRRTYQYVR